MTCLFTFLRISPDLLPGLFLFLWDLPENNLSCYNIYMKWILDNKEDILVGFLVFLAIAGIILLALVPDNRPRNELGWYGNCKGHYWYKEELKTSTSTCFRNGKMTACTKTTTEEKWIRGMSETEYAKYCP